MSKLGLIHDCSQHFVIMILPYFCAVFIYMALCEVTAQKQLLQVQIATPGIIYPVLGGAISYTAPAFDSAFEDITQIYAAVLNVSHTYIYDENVLNCFPMMTDNVERIISEFYYRQARKQDTVVALVFPGCNDVEYVNRLAKAWNILQITSAGGSGHGHENSPVISPTWIAIGKGGAYDYISALTAIFARFSWTTVYIVWDAGSNPMYRSISNDVYKKLMEFGGYQLTFRTINSTRDQNLDYQQLLAEFNRSCRIMAVFGHSNTLRTVMVNAYNSSMANGEHIYFGIQQFYHQKSVGLFKWKNNDENDEVARKAYRSVLVLGLQYSDTEYSDPTTQQIVQAWMNRSVTQYNLSVSEESPFTRPAYNSMMMLATVLNETFVQNPTFDFTDGTELAKRFLNRTFSSKMGTTAISEFGDLVQNLTVRSLNPFTGTMDVVMIYDGFYHKFITTGPIDWPNGYSPPRNIPLCGYLGDAPACYQGIWTVRTTITLASAVLGPIISIVAGAVFAIFCSRYRSSLLDYWWYIDPCDINIFESHTTVMFSRILSHTEQEANSKLDRFSGPAIYLGSNVWLKRLLDAPVVVLTTPRILRPIELSAPARKFLFNELKRCTHKNINRFVGLSSNMYSEKRQRIYLVSEFCSRGSLQDLLRRRLPDWEITCSLAVDLLKGMKFIHSSSLKFHGNLTGYKCLVDNFFILKIGDFGLTKLCSLMNIPIFHEESFITPDQIFWMPPEICKGCALPNQTSDVYSVAITLYQIITGSLPYEEELVAEIVRHGVAKSSTLPSPTLLAVENHLIKKISIIKDCWNKLPEARPTIPELAHSVKKAVDKTGVFFYAKLSFAENLLLRFEKYSRELEALVYLKTNEFLHEKTKSDRLLREILPREVISDLQKGLSFSPEQFDDVSVLFSSMIRCLELVSLLTPLEISQLMAYLFDMMDSAIEAFRVYKMETAADSCMVASGLPIRIGQKHINEICGVAQRMMVVTSRSSQLTSLQLKLAIGIHSGSCVAGIVGINRPRYCIFGDTIKIASQMCSTSEPGKIQISSSTAEQIAKNFSEITLQARGNINIKGKGETFTYWLLEAPC